MIAAKLTGGLSINSRTKTLSELKQTLIINQLWYNIAFSGFLNSILPLLCKNKKNDYNILIYHKWALSLLDIRCSLEKANLLLFPILAYNKSIILGIIDIFWELAQWFEITNEVVKNKIIFIIGDLMTIQNYRRTIYRQQDELLSLDRFQWLKPVAGLFHLQMNLFSMLIGKFWVVTGNLVSLNWYSSILKY